MNYVRSNKNYLIGVGLVSLALALACFFPAPPPVHSQAVRTSAPILGGVLVPSAEVTYSVDQNSKAALANQRLMGWSIYESAASPAVASGYLRGTPGGAGACTGTIYGAYGLAASTGTTIILPQGVDAATGVCIDALEGQVSGIVYTYVQR